MTVRMPILSYNVLLVAINCINEIDCSISGCTRAPVVTGYSRPHGVLVPVYNLTWQSLSCHLGSIAQYQVQFVGNCSQTPVLSLSTGTNETYTVISSPYCTSGRCYFRVRAELRDGSFTDYSPCVLVNILLLPQENVCVPIESACDGGVLPQFTINGQWTLWPTPGNTDYNVSYSQDLRAYSFCFINITHDVMLSEYCYQSHTSSCSICSQQSSEIIFSTFSNIFLRLTRTDPLVTPCPSLVGSIVNSRNVESGLDFKIATDIRILSDTVAKEIHSTVYSVSLDRTHFLSNGTTETRSIMIYYYVGITCSSAIIVTLFGIGLIFISVGVWYKKGKLRRGTDTTYDEPSLPDPVYQEINVQVVSDTNDIEMIGNDCYQLTVKRTS